MEARPSNKPSLSQISVTNWGPISKAEINLGGITFIVGAQNTGKTYLAQLISLLSKFVGNSLLDFGLINAIARHLIRSNLTGAVSPEAVAESVEKNANEVAGNLKEEAIRLKGSLEQLIRTHYLVGVPTDVIRQGQDQSKIHADVELGQEHLLRLTFTMERKGVTNLDLDVNPKALTELVKRARLQLTVFGPGGWVSSRTSPLAGVTRYIPTERFVVVPVFAQLINLLLTLYRGLTQPGILQQQGVTPQLEMRQSFFDYLTDVNNALATSASYELMSIGAIEVVNRQIYFNDSLRHAKVPISSAGSGVAQLTGIVLIAERLGADFLIIEEPEVNLHADAQLEVADYLGKLSSRRSILVTTHSQYLMEKLTILPARGVIADLRGYYIDPASAESRPIEINEKTGEVELPESIEKALETISKEAMALSRQFFGAAA